MDKKQAICRALCESGVYETGQGTCAALCMETLGSARGGPHGCPHAATIHGRAADAVLRAIEEKA